MTAFSKHEDNKKWRFGKICKKNATQIMVFSPKHKFVGAENENGQNKTLNIYHQIRMKICRKR